MEYIFIILITILIDLVIYILIWPIYEFNGRWCKYNKMEKDSKNVTDSNDQFISKGQ